MMYSESSTIFHGRDHCVIVYVTSSCSSFIVLGAFMPSTLHPFLCLISILKFATETRPWLRGLPSTHFLQPWRMRRRKAQPRRISPSSAHHVHQTIPIEPPHLHQTSQLDHPLRPSTLSQEPLFHHRQLTQARLLNKPLPTPHQRTRIQ